eukprot:TRINITY_DN144_c0_g1_i2.p1 TRINITY_DN144_c0_g1~~TRINITY_DN144_c0_g1_i2.p1  ORF type:complete len:214 (-),score=22.52 TRINITY_DN144_c0_g1_i2:44-685(-)
MKTAVVLLLSCLVVLVSSQCTDVDSGVWDKTCPQNAPYCRRPSTASGNQCTKCMEDYDCNPGEYCRNEALLNGVGSCQKFSKYGKKCVPMTTDQKQDTTIRDDWKCAMVSPIPGLPPQSEGGIIEVDGLCLDGVCRQCRVGTSRGYGQGLGPDVECVYPGYYASKHAAPWTPGEYFETPENVWWAIFFVMFFIALILLGLGAFSCSIVKFGKK